MDRFGFLLLAVMLAPLFFAVLMRPAQAWRSKYLPTMDGWRAFACGLVIADHLSRGIAMRLHEAPSWFIHGQHGVNIFFGLSGLLITTKLIEEREQTGTVSLADFYRRRALRLFPAALLYLTTLAVMSGVGWLQLRAIDFAACAFYFRNFVSMAGSVTTAHFWSLAIEEQFYLVVPALFLLLGSRRFQAAAVTGMALSAFCRWWFFLMHPAADCFSGYRTDLRLDGLLAGCLMAVVLADSRARAGLERVLSLPVWFGLFTVLAWWIHRHGEFTTLLESLLVPLLLAGTILRPRTFVARLLEWSPARWMGRISYSLYLWQQLFAFPTAGESAFARLQRFPLNLIALFACAAASYWFVERPLLKWASTQSAAPGRFPGRSSLVASPTASS